MLNNHNYDLSYFTLLFYLHTSSTSRTYLDAKLWAFHPFVLKSTANT